ncbi:MAG: IS200/IS605 family transposase [Acidobacteriota bacterium]
MAGKYICSLTHFVWSTARRQPSISPEWRDRLYSYIGGILAQKNCTLLCAGGVSDHIHLYASLCSTLSLADVTNAMKANSSRWIHQTFPNAKGFSWQKGYGAFSVSKSGEQRLIEYIENQEAHHKIRSFQEEFLALLKKHHVKYDERYLWD